MTAGARLLRGREDSDLREPPDEDPPVPRSRRLGIVLMGMGTALATFSLGMVCPDGSGRECSFQFHWPTLGPSLGLSGIGAFLLLAGWRSPDTVDRSGARERAHDRLR